LWMKDPLRSALPVKSCHKKKFGRQAVNTVMILILYRGWWRMRSGVPERTFSVRPSSLRVVTTGGNRGHPGTQATESCSPLNDPLSRPATRPTEALDPPMIGATSPSNKAPRSFHSRRRPSIDRPLAFEAM